MTGRVEAIHTAPTEGVPLAAHDAIRAVAGVGLDGDRYAAGIGHHSPNGGAGRHVTLIESEVLADLAAQGLELTPGESRRNVTTSGIRLNDLVGQRFRIGEVECIGIRLCDPCAYLQGLVGKPVLKPLVDRAGLRADIERGGTIHVGDEIAAL